MSPMNMLNVNAEEAINEFLKGIIAKGSNEHKKRIEHPKSHGWREMLKKVWYLAFGHFKYLHPEFKVVDFLEGKRFIDLAYIRPPYRIAFEIDGYFPHQKEATPLDFCNERVRGAHLSLDGWIVIRIGYKDLQDRPRIWIQLLQQLIGKYYGHEELAEKHQLYSREEEILRLCHRLQRPVKLVEVTNHLQCGYRTARRLLDGLTDRKVLVRCGGSENRAYAWKLPDDH